MASMAILPFVYLLFFANSAFTGIPNNQDIKMEISPKTSNIMLFKVEESLNLTCKIESDLDGDIHLEWRLPMMPLNSKHRVDMIPGPRNLNLVVRHLKENDSGEYKCSASFNTNPDLSWEKIVHIVVKPSKKCQDSWFPCSVPKCLHKRYTCDGMADCKGGEDEHPSMCGSNPCEHKLMCSDGRCIPYSWCCDQTKDPNCTTKHVPQCCAPLREFPDNRGYNSHETQRYNDVAFFQTTVYTVIGCAMAFMVIVTILVVAICRVQMRRAPTRSPRPPLYELDVLLQQRDFIPREFNPLLVTYNINNGVQFVGRPVAPPPYCEVVAAPPREGPPPPYDENLTPAKAAPKDDSQEGRESDSSLPAASISIISTTTGPDDSTHRLDVAKHLPPDATLLPSDAAPPGPCCSGFTSPS